MDPRAAAPALAIVSRLVASRPRRDRPGFVLIPPAAAVAILRRRLYDVWLRTGGR